MKDRRGVALATALMLLALVLVIGLALASSSMLSLNLSRQNYQETRCSYKARSGVNELVSRLQKLEGDRALQLFNPRPLDLSQEFAGQVELVPDCWLTFSRGPEPYSTDNLLNEGPAAGWLDRGQNSRSVPPFTLELILRARDGNYERNYRALIRRVWPYAIYSAGGPIVLSGHPGDPPSIPAGRSTVHGRVYAELKDGLTVSSPTYDPRSLLFRLVTAGLKAQVDFTRPVVVGPPLDWAPNAVRISGTALAGRPPEEPALYTVSNATATTDTRRPPGNELAGSVDFFHQNGRRSSVEVFPGNDWRGSLSTLVAKPKAPSLRPPDTAAYPAPWNPGLRVWRPYWLTGPVAWTMPMGHTISALAPQGYRYDPNRIPAWLARGRLGFNGTTESPGLTFVQGNIANRVVCDGFEEVAEEAAGALNVEEYPLDLRITDSLLHIQGDADFSNITGNDPEIKGITGNGATLIVEGKLSLTGATLRAGDRGMVIFADSILLSGECDFNGLLVARGSITMIPAPGKHIKIRGGIVAGGQDLAGAPGITLLNANVQFDPRYLKSLNGYGEYRLTAWEPQNNSLGEH